MAEHATREGRTDAAPRAAGLGVGLALQYGLLLLGALLASHLIAMLLMQRMGALLHPISRGQVMATLAAAHTLVRADADAAARQGLPALQQALAPEHGATRLWLDARPDVPAFMMQPEEVRLAVELAQRLALPAGSAIWMQVERVSGQHARAPVFSLASWEPLRLRASIGLADGRWLNASLGLYGRYDWSSILRYTVPASILPVLLVALLFSRRLVRPLRRLIDATGRLRHGSRLPALPLEGPREARELTGQFNAMQERIANHQDARTRLLAAIGHDLRTPVTEVRLLAELVDDDTLRADLLASVADLEALVRGTLDFARADLHAEPLQSVDIAALLGQMAQRYQRLGHDVALHAPAAVQPGFTWPCRPLALKRAVGNLVDNALAHGGAGAIEGIEWEVHADVLQIRVLDRGPGIAPESLARVLEPFQQNDGSRGPQRTGLGLGLPIAAACAEAQGGALTLRNRADGGLCALLTLPRPPQQPA